MNARIAGRRDVLLFTLAASLGSAVLLLALFSESFLTSLRLFFIVPFSDRYFLGNMFASSAPLIVAGLGVAFAFESRNFNLGGEGQIYLGGFVATIVAVSRPDLSPTLAWTLGVLAAMAAGALVGGISGVLKRRLRVDELISTFLISAVVSLAVDFLISGPFQDAQSNFQTTATISAAYIFPRFFPPSSLGLALPIAIVAAGIAQLVMDRTRFGFELKICGTSPEFAQYSGIDAGAYSVFSLAASGALHGLAGALMVFGTQGKALRGFSSGTGWNAIAVSLIAKNNPAAIIPSAIFFAFLGSGARSVTMGSSMTLEIVDIIQAVILFFVTASRIPGLRRRKP